MTSLFKKPATELANLIRSKDLSPVELIDATLRRIEAVNPSINAFVALRDLPKTGFTV
jgi:aspartyl-tRNA(Asn)/glutamyl-tRNA(Gln) amidotransferase subunit A